MFPPLFKIREKGKYGFIDADGEIVVEPQYPKVEDFHNGFARVRVFDRLVFIDALGRPLFKNLFNFIGLMEEGLARVQLVNLWGFIDGRCNLILEVQYEGAGDFSGG